MNFSTQRNRRSLIKPYFSILEERYPHCMQLYKEYPTYEVSFKEFEECTAERLSVLQIIDEANNRSLKGDEWKDFIIAEIRKLPELRLFSKLITGTKCQDNDTEYMVRKRDHISHFVLRLAYCNSEEKRRWFIGREMDLFRFRWNHLSANERADFLRIHQLNYDEVSEEEKLELSQQSEGLVETSCHYYKVHFTLVSDLIKSYKVYLKLGFAYITSEDIISVLLTTFRSQLSQSLSFASRRLGRLDEDERIASVLKGAGNKLREVDYVLEDKDKVDINTLDDLSTSSYPLCMQNLHRALRQDHHLKHFGRQQYGLFLKGIGVTLEDSLRFWRQEFTKKMDVDKFDKQYSYNIRHSYGKEGKMANYMPKPCLSIISGSVNPGDTHGCPFRHKDQTTVKSMLLQNGLSTIGVQEVLDLMRKNQYQMACGKYFEIKHNSEFIVNHPNNYFDESQRILRSKTQPSSAVKQRPNQTPSKSAPSSSKKALNPDEAWEDDAEFDFSAVDIH